VAPGFAGAHSVNRAAIEGVRANQLTGYGLVAAA